MESDVNKDLVFAYFARKTSPLQRERIRRWLEERTNEEQYYEWLEEWENGHLQYLTQSDPAYHRYVAYLRKHPPQAEAADLPEQPAVRANRFFNHWLVAATLVLVFSGLLAAWFRNEIVYVTYRTTFGETRPLRLPDGSTVALNPNSALRLPRWGFGEQTRAVTLTGEADFSVTHTPTNQRFVVKTQQNVAVVVLGTEFTVSARKRGAKVRLTTGKVVLHYREGNTTKQLTMKPGQLATLDRRGHVVLNVPKRAVPYLTEAGKRFVFDETPLREVAHLLEDHYGLLVEINDRQLAERVLMGSLRAENVDQLLQSLSELLDIDVVRQGNRVQFKSH